MESSSPHVVASTISETPERNVHRSAFWDVDHYLRYCLAFRLEGDICQSLKVHFGDIFQRAEESSRIDAGILLAGSKALDPVLSIEIKTMIIALKIDAGQEVWMTNISFHPEQAKVDVLLVAHPLLRNTNHVTVLPRQSRWFDYQNRHFMWGGFCCLMEPVVHPSLWPLTVSKTVLTSCLERYADEKKASMLQPGNISPEVEDDHAYLSNDRDQFTVKDLFFKQSRDFRAMSEYLTEIAKLGATQEIRFNAPKYQPLTADLEIELDTSETFFIEVKFSHCKVVDEVSDKVKIEHLAQHPNFGYPIFSTSSGRWTFLLTEISPRCERFSYGSGSVPSRMALIHRDFIPKEWWTLRDGRPLQMWLPRRWIVEIDNDPILQILSILKDENVGPLTLPSLEDQPSIVKASEDIESGMPEMLGQSENDNDADVAGKSRLQSSGDFFDASKMAHRSHQAIAALRMFRECSGNMQGLLFDFEVDSLSRRHYALTTYAWTQDDKAFSCIRPRCSPTQMFELPSIQTYLYLNFGYIRHQSDRNRFLVPQFVANGIREHITKEEEDVPSQSILILEGEGREGCVQSPGPLYALPLNVIEYTGPRLVVNRGMWSQLQFRKGVHANRFRFDDYEDLHHELIDAMRFSRSSPGNGPPIVEFRGVRVRTERTEDIYRKLQPRYLEWLRGR